MASLHAAHTIPGLSGPYTPRSTGPAAGAAAAGDSSLRSVHRSDPEEASPDPKRRKIRKGTRSCWACKRKKIRCTFSSLASTQPATTAAAAAAAGTTAVCDGCRRRGLPCVSQDLPESYTPDTPDPPTGSARTTASATAVAAAMEENDQLKDRLRRMEAMVEKLVEQASGGTATTETAPTAVLHSATTSTLWDRRRRRPSSHRSWADGHDGDSDSDSGDGMDDDRSSFGLPVGSALDGDEGEKEEEKVDEDMRRTTDDGSHERMHHPRLPHVSSAATAAARPDTVTLRRSRQAVRRPSGIPTPSDTDAQDVAYVTLTTGTTATTRRVVEYAGNSSRRSSETPRPTDAGNREQITYMTWFGHEKDAGYEDAGFPLRKALDPITPTASSVAGRPGPDGGTAHSTTAAVPPSQCRSETATSTPAQQPDAQPEEETGKAAPTAEEDSWGPTYAHTEYMRRYNQMAAAWPAPEDIEAVLEGLSVPRQASMFGMLTFTPTLSLDLFARPRTAGCEPTTAAAAVAVEELLVLPGAGVPLVLMAQRLLLLATVLQHMHPTFHAAVRRLRVARGPRMDRLLGAAWQAALADDVLATSADGLQGLVVLGDFQANAGQLRRAWVTFQHALTRAQLMGLHRRDSLAYLSSLRPRPAALADCRVLDALVAPGRLWFRIVNANRMLSLMLGLPQGAPGDRAITVHKMRAAEPYADESRNKDADKDTTDRDRQQEHFERIERAHAIIVGRIIERNEAWRNGDDDDEEEEDDGEDKSGDEDAGDDADDGKGRIPRRCRSSGHRRATEVIDAMLQRASRSMPVKWWLTPLLEECGDSDGDGDDGNDGQSLFLRARNFLCQVFHYSLLTQLHLPYMLQHGVAGSPGASAAYSTVMCVSASREVLQRFLRLRGLGPVRMYCRSTEFFALLSSMTLCLAHLDSHRRLVEGVRRGGEKAREPASKEQKAFKTRKKNKKTPLPLPNFLAHQRLSDRAMMEHVLASMDESARFCSDELTSRGAVFLRRMLAVEDEAYLGAGAALGCPDAADQLRAQERARGPDETSAIRIIVPLLGTICITKDGIRRVDDAKGAEDMQQEATDQTQAEQAVPAPTQETPAATATTSTSATPFPDLTAGTGNGLSGMTVGRWTAGSSALAGDPAGGPVVGTVGAMANINAIGAGLGVGWGGAGMGMGLPAYSYLYGGADGSAGGFDSGTGATGGFDNTTGDPLLLPMVQQPLDPQKQPLAGQSGAGTNGTAAADGTHFWDLQGVDYAFFENLLLDQRLEQLGPFASPTASVSAPLYLYE